MAPDDGGVLIGRGLLAEVARKVFALSRVVVRAMDKKPQWRVRLDGDSASGVVVGALGSFHVDVARVQERPEYPYFIR